MIAWAHGGTGIVRGCAPSVMAQQVVGKVTCTLGEVRNRADLVIFWGSDPLVSHPRVARVVALSGGYTRADACQRLAANHGMIASFSRALVQDLRVSMSDAEFETALAQSIEEIHRASTVKA